MISEATTNIEYFTMVPYEKTILLFALPLKVQTTSSSMRRLYADARKETRWRRCVSLSDIIEIDLYPNHPVNHYAIAVHRRQRKTLKLSTRRGVRRPLIKT